MAIKKRLRFKRQVSQDSGSESWPFANWRKEKSIPGRSNGVCTRARESGGREEVVVRCDGDPSIINVNRTIKNLAFAVFVLSWTSAVHSARDAPYGRGCSSPVSNWHVIRLFLNAVAPFVPCVLQPVSLSRLLRDPVNCNYHASVIVRYRTRRSGNFSRDLRETKPRARPCTALRSITLTNNLWMNESPPASEYSELRIRELMTLLCLRIERALIRLECRKTCN